MKIQVTEEDIKSGVPDDAANCMIACACIRMGIVDPEVDPGCSTFQAGFKKWVFPPKARDLAHRFDLGEKIEPFEFETEEAEWSKRKDEQE